MGRGSVNGMSLHDALNYNGRLLSMVIMSKRNSLSL